MEKNIGQQAYELLLQDPRWKRKAYYIKQRDHNECVICGETNNLQVHHLNYGNAVEPWNVPNEWLVTLCEKCHKEVHEGKRQIYYPQVGKFYNIPNVCVGIVCKFDKETNNIILLSQHSTEYKPKLLKTRLCYFYNSWRLMETIDERIANWFYTHAKEYSVSIQQLTEQAVSPIAQSFAVGEFADCFLTDYDIAYVRKVLLSFVKNFIIPAVRPKVGNFYMYDHSDYWNDCLCIAVNKPDDFDDRIYMLEYDCGGSSLWIGIYSQDEFYKLQCQNQTIEEVSDYFWDALVRFLRDGEYMTTGYSVNRLQHYEIEHIKEALNKCCDLDNRIRFEIDKAEERRMYQ